MPERLAAVVFAAAAILGVYAAAVALTGGFDVRLAGLRVRSHAWIRPAVPAAILGMAWMVMTRRRIAGVSRRIWPALDSRTTARALTVAAVAWSAIAGVVFGTFAAGGADSYGYVSQAKLFAEGRLTDTVPLEPAYDWHLAHWSLTPLGFVPAPERAVIAPTYPPGLPLLMAPAAAVSDVGMYLVVPLFGALAVWACYGLGRAMDDPLAGGLAAMLVSVSPTFLFQTVQPMSDVPAAACWLASLLLAARGTRAAWAGAAASLAILIRPNLAPLALVPAALVTITASGTAGRLRQAVAFAAAMVPAGVALVWIQHARYGSPLASGYGDVSYLFSLENIVPNLERYPRWLTEVHTPFIWLSAVAPIVFSRRSRDARALVWAAFAFSGCVLLIYLPYVQFQPNEWTYSRFLLPAIPLMLLLATATALSCVRPLPAGVRAPIILALFGGLAIFCVYTAERRRAFDLRAGEQRYVKAGEFVSRRLPTNAIVLASQHSGSVRLYGGRPILRWDLVAPQQLDETLATLRQTGRMPFMVLDDFELKAFHARFNAANQRAVGQARLIRLVENVQVYAFD